MKPKRIKQSVSASKSPFGDSEFAMILAEYLDSLEFESGKERDELIDKLKLLKIGGMYYYGRNGRLDAYIIDGIKKTKNKLAQKYNVPKYLFTLLVREWDFQKNEFGSIPSRTKGYEHTLDLDKFLEYGHVPGLSATPDQLLKEADEAIAKKDIEKYKLILGANGSEESPDTQMMHLGSKEALEAVHRDMIQKQGHALGVMLSIDIIVERKKDELNEIVRQMAGTLAVYEKHIKKIQRVITTFQLFLGVNEKIVQILEGPPAPATDPICIRQSILYMDEEFGDPTDTGKGIEWKDISSFGHWLVRNGNYKKLIPESKCIVAFKARRDPLKRSDNPWFDALLSAVDDITFLVMRNGDNIYRITTDKVDFMPRLFPKRKEMQQLYNLWQDADLAEHKFNDWLKDNPDGGHYSSIKLDWAYSRKDGTQADPPEDKFSDVDDQDFRHNNTEEIKEFAENQVFFYKMRFTMFQGIIERTDVFKPMAVPITLFNAANIDKGLVRLIYDDENLLPSHRKQFWTWIEEINNQITFGSRIVLTHSKPFTDFFSGKYGDEHKADRLDERFGNGKKWSNHPPLPQPGLYYVQAGTIIENEPVWIDNPFYNPDLITTPDTEKYAPDFNLKDKPKDLKGYYRTGKYSSSEHICRDTNVFMTYEQQREYFGKVVIKASGPGKFVDGFEIDFVVHNPKRIHKYEMTPDFKKVKGEWVETKKKSPEFQYHDVVKKFLCIRYNPKDTVGKAGMFRHFQDEPEERKNKISWKIFTDDEFLINYDLITLDDINFYLESRVDRRHYLAMMPLLSQLKKELEREQKSEKDFKRLVAGEVLKVTGETPEKDSIDKAVESWKKDLKWKRAVSHDDVKALRMIVKALVKEIKSGKTGKISELE